MTRNGISIKPAGRSADELLVELRAAYRQLEQVTEELQAQNEELKASHDALEVERRRYQDLFEFAPHGYLVTDLHGTIVTANRAAAALLGVERDRLPGRPLSSSVKPPDVHILSNHLAHLQAGKMTASWEMRLAPPASEPIDVAVQVSAVDGETGTPGALRWLIRDVTERKRIEAQQQRLMAQIADDRRLVEELAARDEAILASLTEGLVIFDLEGRVLHMNQAALRLHGYHRPEEVRQHLHDYGSLYSLSDMEGRPLPMDDWPAARVLRGQAFTTAEVRIRDRRTDREWIGSYGGAPVRDRSGTVILGIVTVRDVTAEKEDEASGRRQREFLERLIESAPLGIAVVRGPENRYEVVNHRYRLLTDMPKTAMVGRTVAEVFPETEAAGRLRLYDQVRRTGRPLRFKEYQPTPNTTRASNYWDVDLVPLTDSRGNVESVLTLLHDVTEEVVARDALRRQKEELQTLAEELEAYDQTVAHDLKNPLSMIVSSADLLAHDLGDLPDQEPQRKLNNILYAARRMNEIVESLLLLTSTRSQEVPIEALDMAEIVAGTRRDLAGLILRRGAEVRCSRSWPGALGYAPWVQSVWANYLSNALKYGGDPPRIELGADEQANGVVRFWVRDHGPGLTEEQQARLFTTFSRLDRPSKLGHGLGLAIVRRIAEKLGGQAGVESRAGDGSTFWFTLLRA